MSLTKRLQSFMRGDAEAADALMREVLPKLYEIAARELRQERFNVPVQKTELINELWIRNLSKGGWHINDRGHFFALASLAMRRVLVDMARHRLALRRGGVDSTVPLSDHEPQNDGSVREAHQIVEIGILMERLETHDPDAARMVDAVYFAGFTLEEIAADTGLTARQVRGRWERGRKWLKKNLRGRPDVLSAGAP